MDDGREQRLPGGNVSGAWRVGQTVRRVAGPWTPAVADLLRHLEGRVPAVPRFHGIDEHGREVLDYLAGEVIDVDREALSEPRLAALAGWTRLLHDATMDFAHPGPWRAFTPEQPTLIGHGDVAPWNACFAGDELIGVFDWDLAGPSTPLWELGFLAWSSVPLFRPEPAPWCARRLEIIAESYDSVSGRDVLDAVFPRIEASIAGIPRAAAAGDVGMQALMAGRGEPEPMRRSLADLRTRVSEIAARL